MIAMRWLIILCVLSSSLVAQVPSPTGDLDASEIAALIADLDGEDFDRREAAFAGLVERGPAIRDQVMKAKESAGLELRLRLEALLEAVSAKVDKPPVSLEPTLVSVDAAEATFGSAVAQLRRQGVRFHGRIGDLENRVVDITAKDRPLLEVLDLLGDQTNSRWSVLALDGSVRFNGRLVGTPLRFYVGPTRFMLTAATRNATRQFGEEIRQTTYIQGLLDLEPGAPILGVWHPPFVDTIESPEGASLIDDAITQRHNFNPATNRTSFHFSFRVKLPAEPVKTIAKLAGRAKVALPGSYRVVTVPLGGEVEGRTQRNGSLKATIETLREIENGWQVTVHVAHERVWVDDARRQEVKDQVFELLTEDGRVVTPARPATPRADREGDRFQIDFATTAKPEALTIRCLESIETRELAFEFRDVPLP